MNDTKNSIAEQKKEKSKKDMYKKDGSFLELI